MVSVIFIELQLNYTFGVNHLSFRKFDWTIYQAYYYLSIGILIRFFLDVFVISAIKLLQTEIWNEGEKIKLMNAKNSSEMMKWCTWIFLYQNPFGLYWMCIHQWNSFRLSFHHYELNQYEQIKWDFKHYLIWNWRSLCTDTLSLK